jgi:hypothetical protein
LEEKIAYNGTVHQLTVEFRKACDSFWREVFYNVLAELGIPMYSGADKSLARCILFDSENTSFYAILVIYKNSTNIPPIMIINRICEYQNLQLLVSFLAGLRTYQHPCSSLEASAR